MITRDFPILEFDSVSQPVVKAKKYLPDFVSLSGVDHCLITYFSDVVEQYERVFAVNQVFKIRTEGVRPCVYHMLTGPFKRPIYVVPMPVGAPNAARILEAMSAIGVKKFMVCGGAGTLDDSKTGDNVLVPVAAVRDEGTSYHYIHPSREVAMNPDVLKKIERTLRAENVEYVPVKTWTTDGIFRETADRVALRKAEGCDVVEMECSAFYAVAEHKRLLLGQLLYAGDVVSHDEWNYRDWHTKYDKREKLFNLAVKCLLEL